MKKSFVTGLILLGLLTASLIAAPVHAKKSASPTTLYFHGNEYVGEVEIPDGVNGLYRQMDAAEPTDPAPKSVALLAVGAAGNGTPNPQCSGNPLFPVWVGDVTGTIVGDLKVSLDSVSLPATKVDVRVWGFVPGLGACDSQGVEGYVEPFAETRVDVPPGPGTIEAVLENKKFKTEGRLMIQFTPVLDGATATRVLYDSTATLSQIDFNCIPTKGKSCTP